MKNFEEKIVVNDEHAASSRPNWCDTRGAAAYLGVAIKTLEHWRCVGGGPQYAKAGRRCLYRYSDLEAWLLGRTVSCTAEARRVGLI